MRNIVIYSQKGTSALEVPLKQVEDYSVQVRTLEAIKEPDAFAVDLVVLDMPVSDIKEILVRTKVPVPLLIVSDHIFNDVTVRAEAYDYILTPVKNEELIVRAANLVRIKQLKEEIGFVTTTDELTGLFNRRYLHERLEAELSRAKRYKFPISCLLLDIDFFKVVNDMYGYEWGDILLKNVSEVLKKRVRKEDILTRYGDEEFLIVLPNTDEDNAYIFAERVRKDIEEMEFIPEGEEEKHPITISGGISSYPSMVTFDDTAHSLIRYSEHALYNAKQKGKNKIIKFSQINLEF